MCYTLPGVLLSLITTIIYKRIETKTKNLKPYSRLLNANGQRVNLFWAIKGERFPLMNCSLKNKICTKK